LNDGKVTLPTPRACGALNLTVVVFVRLLQPVTVVVFTMKLKRKLQTLKLWMVDAKYVHCRQNHAVTFTTHPWVKNFAKLIGALLWMDPITKKDLWLVKL